MPAYVDFHSRWPRCKRPKPIRKCDFHCPSLLPPMHLTNLTTIIAQTLHISPYWHKAFFTLGRLRLNMTHFCNSHSKWCKLKWKGETKKVYNFTKPLLIHCGRRDTGHWTQGVRCWRQRDKRRKSSCYPGLPPITYKHDEFLDLGIFEPLHAAMVLSTAWYIKHTDAYCGWKSAF